MYVQKNILDIINLLTLETGGNTFKSKTFEHILRVEFMSNLQGIAVRWMPENILEDM